MSFSKIPELMKLFSNFQDLDTLNQEFKVVVSENHRIVDPFEDVFFISSEYLEDYLKLTGIKNIKLEMIFYYWSKNRLIYNQRSLIKSRLFQFVESIENNFYPFEHVNKSKNTLFSFYVLDQYSHKLITYREFHEFCEKVEILLKRVHVFLSQKKWSKTSKLDWNLLALLTLAPYAQTLEQMGKNDSLNLSDYVKNYLDEDLCRKMSKVLIRYSYALNDETSTMLV